MPVERAGVRLPRSFAQQARTMLRAVRRQARDLAPVQSTAHRLIKEAGPPPPSAFAAFGEHSWVVPPTAVSGAHRIEIGARVHVLEFSTLDVIAERDDVMPALVLSDGVHLARFNTVTCGVGITIGEAVASSDSVAIFDTWFAGVPGPTDQLPEAAPIVIGRNAYLGCNSTVCPGVTIGKGAYVGEGAVVIDNVPDHSVVYGNPAKIVRQYDPAVGAWRERVPR